MDKRISDAVNYGADSNKLEDNKLTDEEIKKVLTELERNDKSFLYSVVEMINKEKEEDNDNVKTRK